MSSLFPAQNEIYTFASSRRQRFSFPSDMMHKIAKKPNSLKVFEKLLKTCKWFFIKNPVIALPSLSTLMALGGNKFQVCPRNLNFYSFYKFWITKTLDISSENPEFFNSILLPKIYRCDASAIYISMQIILFDSLKFFLDSPNLKELYLTYIIIKHEGKKDDLVSLHEICNIILPSNVFEFTYVFENKSACTINLKLRETNTIEATADYKISNIPENFDVAEIYHSLKTNKNISLSFKFESGFSGEYKTRLEIFIQNVIKECRNNSFINPPNFVFDSQCPIVIDQLKLLQEKFNFKHKKPHLKIEKVNYSYNKIEKVKGNRAQLKVHKILGDEKVNRFFDFKCRTKVDHLQSLKIKEVFNEIKQEFINLRGIQELFDLLSVINFYIIVIYFEWFENMKPAEIRWKGY